MVSPSFIMTNFANSKNKIQIIDSIIKSMNDSILVLEHSNEINQTAYDSVCNILKFINNTIIMLPLIIYSKGLTKISKDELIHSFDKVLNSWSEYLINSEDFIVTWNIFLANWNAYKHDYEKSGESSRTIFLSMN